MKSKRSAQKWFILWIIAAPVVFILVCLVYSTPAMSSEDSEIESLREQVESLSGRVDELEKEKADQPKVQPGKAYWKDGFRIEYKDEENDREYRFRFRIGIQPRYTYTARDEDIRSYRAASFGTRPDQDDNYSSFNMRRLRFYVDGTAPAPDWHYYIHVQLEPSGSVNTHDGYIRWQKYSTFRVHFGRMKLPAYGMDFWQSGFKQNGTDRTIFTGDGESDKDLFGNYTYDFPGGNARLRTGGHRLRNGFPTGGALLYRSQGININGYLDAVGKNQFLAYWLGVYNGRDSTGWNNPDEQMLYTGRLGINFLSGSDPGGPMASSAFAGYTAQGDMGHMTKPLGAFIVSGFWDNDKMKTYYTVDPSASGFMGSDSTAHDIENYGFSGTLLYRYKGFSSDLEYAWEEFIQDPGHGDSPGRDQETWDRWFGRVNLGYFIEKEKWEVVAKYAYVERLMNNSLEDSVKSGLGLVLLDKDNPRFAVEDSLQQVVLGVNRYLQGFNHYITADIAWLHRSFKTVSLEEAGRAGLAIADFDPSPDDQNEFRFRVMFQFLF